MPPTTVYVLVCPLLASPLRGSESESPKRIESRLKMMSAEQMSNHWNG
jgi:hypothetical protein